MEQDTTPWSGHDTAKDRLREERCFAALVATDLQGRGVPLEVVATSRGAMQHGRLLALHEMSH
jgi:hypothetical protein